MYMPTLILLILIMNTYLFTYHFSIATGEPNNAKGDEDCLEIDGQLGYRWNDCPCNGSNNGYICMKGGIHFIYKKIVVGHLTLF